MIYTWSFLQYVFKVAMHALWRDVDPDSEDMELYRNGMALLFDATRALRINLPGFYFHKAMKVCPPGGGNSLIFTNISDGRLWWIVPEFHE